MNNKYQKSADCNNCFLRKGEYCTQLRNIPCADYKPLPMLTLEERKSWPVMQVDTAIRIYGCYRD